ncbi:MAG: hypothetical protein Q9227_007073 [Pyrenula ochraceoflavens]
MAVLKLLTLLLLAIARTTQGGFSFDDSCKKYYTQLNNDFSTAADIAAVAADQLRQRNDRANLMYDALMPPSLTVSPQYYSQSPKDTKAALDYLRSKQEPTGRMKNYVINILSLVASIGARKPEPSSNDLVVFCGESKFKKSFVNFNDQSHAVWQDNTWMATGPDGKPHPVLSIMPTDWVSQGGWVLCRPGKTIAYTVRGHVKTTGARPETRMVLCPEYFSYAERKQQGADIRPLDRIRDQEGLSDAPAHNMLGVLGHSARQILHELVHWAGGSIPWDTGTPTMWATPGVIVDYSYVWPDLVRLRQRGDPAAFMNAASYESLALGIWLNIKVRKNKLRKTVSNNLDTYWHYGIISRSSMKAPDSPKEAARWKDTEIRRFERWKAWNDYNPNGKRNAAPANEDNLNLRSDNSSPNIDTDISIDSANSLWDMLSKEASFSGSNDTIPAPSRKPIYKCHRQILGSMNHYQFPLETHNANSAWTDQPSSTLTLLSSEGAALFGTSSNIQPLSASSENQQSTADPGPQNPTSNPEDMKATITPSSATPYSTSTPASSSPSTSTHTPSPSPIPTNAANKLCDDQAP